MTHVLCKRNDGSLPPFPTGVPRPVVPRSRSHAPSPTLLMGFSTPSPGKACGATPLRARLRSSISFHTARARLRTHALPFPHVAARKQERPTKVAWPGRQSPVPSGTARLRLTGTQESPRCSLIEGPRAEELMEVLRGPGLASAERRPCHGSAARRGVGGTLYCRSVTLQPIRAA